MKPIHQQKIEPLKTRVLRLRFDRLRSTSKLACALAAELLAVSAQQTPKPTTQLRLLSQRPTIHETYLHPKRTKYSPFPCEPSRALST